MKERKDPESISKDGRYDLLLNVYGGYFVGKYLEDKRFLKCNPTGHVDTKIHKMCEEHEEYLKIEETHD